MIATADFNTEMDRLIQAWRRLRDGVVASLDAIEELDSLTFSDFSSRADLSPANATTKARLDPDTVSARDFKGLLTRIERHVQVHGGYGSLDAFLSALNPTTGTKWTGLQNWRLRDLWQLWKGAGQVPSVHNLYFELLQGATYANALAKLVVSGAVFTTGSAVDTSKYAGGFGYLLVSGFAGSTDIVTVTGTQFNPATRTATAGKTWTASVTGNGSFALTAGTADADSLIAAVSAIAAGGSISGGTIYVEARRPAGRVDIES